MCPVITRKNDEAILPVNDEIIANAMSSLRSVASLRSQ